MKIAAKPASSLAVLEAGGRSTLATRLMFLAEEEKLVAFREAFEADPKADLAALCKQVGLAPRTLLAALSEAAVAFEREVAKRDATISLPAVVDNLKSHAFPRMRKCPRCWGVRGGFGQKSVVKLGEAESICPLCDGAGEFVQDSAHMTWANEKLLKIGELPLEKSGPLVNVDNRSVNVRAGAGSFLERMILASDDIVSRASLPEPPAVEAVSVRPVDNQS